ncbi:hypothetical protein KBC75_03230 [Candidatus Shapirobacteria bacterium]|nr:hypothetical protein [Candidatus Shapirobacteria bacterium]
MLASALAEGVALWSALKDSNFTALNYSNLFVVPVMGINTVLMLNRFNLARKFAGAAESLAESKIGGNANTINLPETQAELLKISKMDNKETVSGHLLLEIAREQAKRMSVITKYRNTNDLQMLDTQRDVFQKAYIEFRLSDKKEFEAPELKTVSNEQSDKGLADFKNAWMDVAKIECEWALAQADGNRQTDADKFDLAYYATTLDDSRGLDGNLVKQVVTIKKQLIKQ